MHYRQFCPYLLIARPGVIDQRLKAIVNLLDNLHMTRQQRFHQLLIPALQRFWHQGVVGVGEGFAGDSPGVIPAQLVLVNQHAQQFRNGDGRVSIVQLNDLVIRQLMQFASGQMMATQNIRYRAGALEVLLHQAQFFARRVVIVGIKHLRQFFRIDTLLFRPQESAVVEFGQIKRMRVGRLPQTQRLRDAVTIA